MVEGELQAGDHALQPRHLLLQSRHAGNFRGELSRRCQVKYGIIRSVREGDRGGEKQGLPLRGGTRNEADRRCL